MLVPTAAVAVFQLLPLSSEIWTISLAPKLALSVPLMVCAAVLVMKSVLEVPVSLEKLALVTVVVGVLVSMVTARPDETVLTLPAASVVFALSECTPGLNRLLVMDQLPLPSATTLPSTLVPLLSYSVTVEPASAVPLKVSVVTLVMLSLFEVPLSLALARSGVDGAAGANVSKLSAGVLPAPPLLPAVSV